MTIVAVNFRLEEITIIFVKKLLRPNRVFAQKLWPILKKG